MSKNIFDIYLAFTNHCLMNFSNPLARSIAVTLVSPKGSMHNATSEICLTFCHFLRQPIRTKSKNVF